MKRHRFGVFLIAFVAEFCAAGSGLLTLCIHEDGSSRFELSADLCCSQNAAGGGECGSFEMNHPCDENSVTPDDSCQDYDVVFAQVPVLPPSLRHLLLTGFIPWELLPPADPVPSGAPATWTEQATDSPTFRDRTLNDLSTIVLRI